MPKPSVLGSPWPIKGIFSVLSKKMEPPSFAIHAAKEAVFKFFASQNPQERPLAGQSCLFQDILS